jgi:hypothetical protein
MTIPEYAMTQHFPKQIFVQNLCGSKSPQNLFDLSKESRGG